MNRLNPKSILQTLPYAYALHQFVLDDQGNPCDYIFLDANPLFEKYTGLKAEMILGKRVTEIIPDIEKDSFHWIATYARVAFKCESMKFEQYSEALQRWYQVDAYSPEEGFFITLFSDITDEKEQELKTLRTEKSLQRQAILLDIFSHEFTDQQKFLEYALERALDFTESKYGYIFLYDEDIKEFNLNVFSAEVVKDSRVITPRTRYKLEETGYWGESVRQRKPLINNNFAAPSPLKRGRPDGHVMLKRFLSIPVFIDQRIVAVVGLANKAEEYTDLDVSQLILLMQSVWLINTQRYLKSSLKLHEQKTIDILNHVPLLLREYDADTTLRFVNDAYCEYVSIKASDLIGRKFLDFIPENEHEFVLEGIRQLTPLSPRGGNIHRAILKDGIRWTEWSDVAVFDSNGNAVTYYSIGVDVTERKNAEEEMERSLELMKAMFDGHVAPMFLIEPKTGSIHLCNQAAADFFGYSKEELCEMQVHSICPLDTEEVNTKLRKVFEAKSCYISVPSRLKSGDVRIIDIFNSLVIYNDNQLFFSIIFDTTDREKALAENTFLQNHDLLTKTYNRNFLRKEYQHLNVPKNYPLAMITCDINGLNRINQALSSRVGDTLLIRFAETLQDMVEPRSILARIGGGEFAILLSSVSEEEVKNLTILLEEEAMPRTRSKLPELSSVEVTASFGYGLQLSKADTLSMLINEAEAFMLHRKYYNSSSKQSQVISAIMNALYEKSEREQLHSKRVSHISVMIAQALELPEYEISEIKTASILHDIGKIGIDEKILNKPSVLSVQEMLIMRQHSIRSARILIGVDEYKNIVPIVRAHHERFDGSGYPDGLEGENIPLSARIIAIADSYDAMTVQRPYRDVLSKEEAVEELIRCSGSQFDPSIVTAFVELIAEHL